jgi:hypothetical protein
MMQKDSRKSRGRQGKHRNVAVRVTTIKGSQFTQPSHKESRYFNGTFEIALK